jgi:alpha-L-rhamnosidase
MNTRIYLSVTLFCLTALLFQGCSKQSQTTLWPAHLQIENRNEPLGIDEKAPRLSWQLMQTDTRLRGLHQFAYQIQVASSTSALLQNKPDMWDTGKVHSEQTHDIVFSGNPLNSNQDYYWRVMVWDQDAHPSAWSQPSHWSMGFLNHDEWKAKWIGLDTPTPTDGSALTEAQHNHMRELTWIEAGLSTSKESPLSSYFRRTFLIPEDDTVIHATLTFTADQNADISLNGTYVSTVHRRERTHITDVTSHLKQGTNCLALFVNQEDGYPPATQGELEINLKSGKVLRVTTDANWHWNTEKQTGWDYAVTTQDSWPLANVLTKKSPWGTFDDSTLYLPPAPYLRKDFSVSRPVAKATLYATALGLYELHLNGLRIGHDFLTPGWTDYSYRVQYQAYDITKAISTGANTLGAILGTGWFAGTVGYTGRNFVYGGAPRFAAQLEITYADGSHETVISDKTWKATTGAITYADLYQGSSVDMRTANNDWSKPGYNTSNWQTPAVGWKTVGYSPRTERIAPGKENAPAKPPHIIEASNADPVCIHEEVAATSITEIKPGTYIVDFGQNLVGWIKFKAQGERGQSVIVRHAEMLNPNGTIYTSNLRGAQATDSYILSGSVDTLEPYFTFHGFRYAEISGLKSKPDITTIHAEVVHNALERTGDFSCSDPRVNQLFHNIIWGQKSNYIEAPTDCPQRDERMGWTGDTGFFIRTATYNYNVKPFIERWLTTLITDEQTENGFFPSVAPIGSRGDQHASTAWGDVAVTGTYNLWHVYSDTRIIERHFESLVRYMGFLQSHTIKGITYVGGYGDWVNLGGGAPAPVIDTAYYIYLCDLMSQMASAINKSEYANFYSFLKNQSLESFKTNFLLPNGQIKDSSQTAYALAFTMHLLPDEMQQKSSDQFLESVKKFDWHLATGFIGTPRLLPGLHDAGLNDVAYKLLLQDTYPSWLYQVKLGATTMWERWDGWTKEKGFQTIGMNSFNHYAFGSVGEFMYRYVAGIDTEGAGFKTIAIAPYPGPGLTSARASYQAVTGLISTDWLLSKNTFSLEVKVPPNTVSHVRIPTSNPDAVLESGKPIEKASCVKVLSHDSKALYLEVQSGTYRFTAPYTF